jgi:hypothetical protein
MKATTKPRAQAAQPDSRHRRAAVLAATLAYLAG